MYRWIEAELAVLKGMEANEHPLRVKVHAELKPAMFKCRTPELTWLKGWDKKGYTPNGGSLNKLA